VITIESRDPQIRVKDVLKEFKIQTIDEVVETSRVIQDKSDYKVLNICME
jgi:hypothetical protein